MTSFSVFIGIYFMFRRFGSVDGYTFEEVLICYAAVLFSFTAAECFFRGFDAFSSFISNGEFDRAMVRPRPVMLQVLCSRIEFARCGRFLQAAVILSYAIPQSGVVWTPVKAVTLFLMCVGGTALFAGLFIIYAGICFFTLEGLEFMNIFTDGGRELGKYPIDIYGTALLRFYTFIVPLACVQYYPFCYIVGRSSSVLYTLLPLAAFVFLIPCYAVWRLGVRHYKSTGS
jgi:ABC-2 type transport system permease protein